MNYLYKLSKKKKKDRRKIRKINPWVHQTYRPFLSQVSQTMSKIINQKKK